MRYEQFINFVVCEWYSCVVMQIRECSDRGFSLPTKLHGNPICIKLESPRNRVEGYKRNENHAKFEDDLHDNWQMWYREGQRCDSEIAPSANPPYLLSVLLLNVRQFMSNHEVELGAMQPVDTNICHPDKSRSTMGIHQSAPAGRVYEYPNQAHTHLFRHYE